MIIRYLTKYELSVLDLHKFITINIDSKTNIRTVKGYGVCGGDWMTTMTFISDPSDTPFNMEYLELIKLFNNKNNKVKIRPNPVLSTEELHDLLIWDMPPKSRL